METALILKVTGSVQESNLSEFEKSAREFIGGINTTLVTDQEFGQAKKDVNSCKEKEIQIENAKQKAIMSMDEISKILTTVAIVSDEIRDTRLNLEKLVKTEEAKRKKEITDGGIKRVEERLLTYPMRGRYIFDKSAIISATKGKRSLLKMEEAVEELVDDLINDIDVLEAIYYTNFKAIEAAMVDYPLLFADKRDLFLQPIEVVDLTITSRINEFKISEQKRIEAERIAREATKKKAEEERIAKEKADKEKEESDRLAAEQNKNTETVEAEPTPKRWAGKPMSAMSAPIAPTPPTPPAAPDIAPNPFLNDNIEVLTANFIFMGTRAEFDTLCGRILAATGVESLTEG